MNPNEHSSDPNASFNLRETSSPYKVEGGGTRFAGTGDTADKPESEGPPGHPEPWSHPWLDQLGLLYHQAIAEKIRVHPELRQVAIENIDRWMARNDYPVSIQKSLLWWREMLSREPMDNLICQMTDRSEAGHQIRQNTPFAGILSQDERRVIREAYEEASTR